MNAYEKTVSWWQNRGITTEADLALAFTGHEVSFAYHSGKIENDQITYHDTREIFDHDGVTDYTGDLRTLFEIRNAKDANTLFLASFGTGRSFEESLLLAFHLELTKNTYDTHCWQLGERPGTYKLHDYVTGKEEVGASPEDVSEEMSELLAELQDIPEQHALTAAAYFHAKFENIHPFADGNGRTGRIAMNYLLVLHNHPPVIIHEEERKDYYDALEAWDLRQDLEPLKSFLKEQTVKTWEKQRAVRRPTVNLNSFL